MNTRLTLRIPILLYNQIIDRLNESKVNVSLNTFVLKCVEKELKKKKRT